MRLAKPRVKSLLWLTKEKDEAAGRKEEEKVVRMRIGCLRRKDTMTEKKQSEQVTFGFHT